MRAHKMLWVALLIGVPFVALAAEPPGPATETTSFARGASLYSANCGRCHNPRGPAEYSDGHWPLIVTHMRVIAGLPGDQAREIEAFLRASNNPAPRRLVLASRRAAGPVDSGEVLFTRFGCRGCHKLAGEGGLVGPSLDGLFRRRSEEWVRVQIQTPREHNSKTVMPQLGLTNEEVTAILEVLRSPH